jgi:ketosteroid isomerase-like protein
VSDTLKSVATTLIDLCRRGENLQAIERLYSDDVVSVEASEDENAGMTREMSGRDAILDKNRWWLEHHEVHGGDVKGPYYHGGDRFAVVFDFDVTHKPSGKRMRLEEVGVYEVSGGKIVREAFFYDTPE